jgi:DNA-binding IscR family transcriptional regulator
MIIMNATDHYRLAALMELARRHPAQIPGAEIARSCDIPHAYFSRLVPEMVRQGVLRSRRGPGGGLCLAVAPDQLTLDRLIRTSPTDGAATPAGRELSRRLAARVRDELASLTLAEVAEWNAPHTAQPDYVI